MAKVKRSRPATKKQVEEVIKFVRHTNQFGSVMRTIWRQGASDGPEGRERNDSHVCQLMDVAWFMVQRWFPQLDLLKVWKYCMVHDKPEVYAGDTPAFADKNGVHNGPSRASKKEREHQATLQLLKEWGRTFPDFLESLATYERMEDDESKFVYALDKFLSDLNIYVDGGRTNLVLGITREEQVAYKRPKVAVFPPLLEFYDVFMESLPGESDLFFMEEPKLNAAE